MRDHFTSQSVQIVASIRKEPKKTLLVFFVVIVFTVDIFVLVLLSSPPTTKKLEKRAIKLFFVTLFRKIITLTAQLFLFLFSKSSVEYCVALYGTTNQLGSLCSGPGFPRRNLFQKNLSIFSIDMNDFATSFCLIESPNMSS